MKPFQVPLGDDELLEDNNDRFTVDQEPTPNQVVEHLHAFGDALASDNAQWQELPEYFDYFFACFRWMGTIFSLLSKEESCVSACDLFVQLWFGGKLGGRCDREQAKNSLDTVVDSIVEKLKDSFMRESVTAAARIETEELDQEDKVVEHRTKMEQLNSKIQYYTEAIEFASQLQTVLPKIGRLLRFGQSSEVTEAIKLIVACRMFHVPGSHASVRELCRLIWRNDVAIKEAVVNACNQLFLSTGSDSADNLAKQTAKNLIGLVRGADVKEQSSVEEVVCEMMKLKPFHGDVLKHLWAYLDQRTDQPEGRCALKLLGMIGRAERSVIKANVAHLLEKGLGEQAEKDFSFAADACYALSMLGNKVDLKNEDSIRKDPYRLPKDDPLFERLFHLLSNGFNRLEDDHWTPMMERALNVVFFIADQPDKFGAKLLISCVEKTIAVLSASTSNAEKDVDLKTRDKCIVRVFALIGHLALRMLIYVDIAYCGEMKRREQITAMLRSPSRKKRRTTAIKRESQQISRSPASDHGSVIELCDDDMGLAGASAEDIDQENAARILDKEVLSDSELLGKAAPLVLYVLQRERMNKFSPAVLTAASLALSKLMLLSERFGVLVGLRSGGKLRSFLLSHNPPRETDIV
uniref:Condensin complex subunit 1 n=1 Tax=Plectus sambesii TaxID=2011161 RepID=A0A914UUJ0_9BILA